MSNWYIAPALEVLRHQLNALYPLRSKASDGGIGDTNHANRSSDHNPHVRDEQGRGVVTARDFTHDPANGLDCNELAKALVASRDPRIKYIIWNRQICSSKTSPWKWRPYKGTNPHDKHLHLSVSAERYGDIAAWNLSTAPTTRPTILSPQDGAEEQGVSDPASQPSNYYTVRTADTLWQIAGHFGTTVAALLAANPEIKDADFIKPGMSLRVKL